MQSAKHRSKISRPHMLSGVHTESCHADTDQVVQVACDGVSDVVLGEFEINQADQTTVSYFIGVVIIVDVSVPCATLGPAVKIPGGVGHAGIAERSSVPVGSARPRS